MTSSTSCSGSCSSGGSCCSASGPSVCDGVSSCSDCCDLGVYGLGVMGCSLALNFASRGLSVAVWNRSPAKVDDAVARAKKEKVEKLCAFKDLACFVKALKSPRRIILMIQAGPAVDSALAELLPSLTPGDLLVDGGNEYYQTTEKRLATCNAKGIRYLGMGVSGGEEGARYGPAMMPGGDKEGYLMIADDLKRVAARHEDDPCVSFIGPGGSGQYVKMVHNGIEYAEMQLIAEAYHALKQVCGLSNDQLQAVFASAPKHSSSFVFIFIFIFILTFISMFTIVPIKINKNKNTI
eukprot:GHVT01022048.1.p1 GENE.GHVT01022048.1~~GHVT01022048.1.p1  ORF type:complete len:294 (-),score=67.68 GHVT01022048.1:11-892(-)